MPDGFVRPFKPEQLRVPPELLDEVLGPARHPKEGNRALLEALDRTDVLEFRGVPYLVPPVPFLAGLELHERVKDFERLSARAEGREGMLEVRAAVVSLLELMVSLVRPMQPAPRPSLLHRLLAALRIRALPPAPPHPFFECSVLEVAELISFFGDRSRTLSVRSPSRAAPNPARSTSAPA